MDKRKIITIGSTLLVIIGFCVTSIVADANSSSSKTADSQKPKTLKIKNKDSNVRQTKTPQTPNDLLRNMQRRMNQVMSRMNFNKAFSSNLSHFNNVSFNNPRINFTEKENKALVRLIVPGMDKSDLSIRLKGDYLIIKGKKTKKDKEENKYLNYSKTFKQVLRIPSNINTSKISSKCENGILTINLPKVKKDKKEEKSKTIPIK